MEKHKRIIVMIILFLFVITQLIGLFLISKTKENFFLKEEEKFGIGTLINILLSFVVSVTLLLVLIQYKIRFFLRLWFFLVILITTFIFFYSLFSIFFEEKFYIILFSSLISLMMTTAKIYRPSVIIHNFSEIFIYGGLSLIFISFLTPFSITILLLIISFYDMWAVWHSGIMQRIAKFQMNEIKIFNGFVVPYMTKEIREKMKKNKGKRKKIKIPLAILGGGDIAFSLITSGVFLKYFGWTSALFVVIGSTLGLGFLMLKKEKNKFYPAMPFITLGIFFSIILSFLMKHLQII